MKDFSCWCLILGIIVILIIHLILEEYGILENFEAGELFRRSVESEVIRLRSIRENQEEEATNPTPIQGESSQELLGEELIGGDSITEDPIEQTLTGETSEETAGETPEETAGETPSPSETPGPSPIDCDGSWGDWSNCSETCGGGEKTREYSITTPSENGGDECSAEDGETETESCNTQACPVNCQGSWGNWSICNKKFGEGRKFREYTITTPASNGGQPCPHANHRLEMTNCKENNKSGIWFQKINQNSQNVARHLAYKQIRDPAEIRSMGGVGWPNIPGSLKQVDTDGNKVCGVNSNDNIFCKDSFTGTSWRNIPGKLKYVSVSNGKLYGVNSNDQIFYKPNTSASGGWQNISGRLKQVDIDGNKVCGVNSNDQIFCKDNLTGSNWRNLPGRLKHVSVSDGKLYGVNSSNQIYYKNNTNTNNDWKNISGSLKQVDIDGNKVCGVNSSNEIFCKDGLTGSKWKNLPGRLKHVSVSNGKLYGVNPRNQIFYRTNTNA